jgi:NTE family protein
MNRDVNLVLEGGGVKGIAHAGAVAKLTERGYVIKRVAGASVGAIVAALVAAGMASEIEALMTSFPFDAMRSTGKLRAAWSLMNRGGQFPIAPLRNWLNETLEGRTFKDLTDYGENSARSERRYKLVVTVADVTRGELVHLPWDYRRVYGLDPDRQLVADAVCASAAFPFFFVPLTIECRVHSAASRRAGRMTSTLIDGGLLSNFPIELFHEHDAGHGIDKTFGVKILPHLPTPPGDATVVWTPNTHLRPVRLIQQMVGTMVAGRDQARLELPSVARRVIQIDTSGASILDFGITAAEKAELFRSGREATAAFLHDWERSNG